LSPILHSRLAELEAAKSSLANSISDLQGQLDIILEDLTIVKSMLKMEARRLGIAEPSDRFLRMDLSDIAKEFIQKGLTKEDMLQHMESINYPFKSKRHSNAVHLGWVNGEKRLK
jgi:hypothetical protein